MDPAAHRRFLDYLELWPVFQSPDRPKLDRETFVAFDAEYRELTAKKTAGTLDLEGSRRLGALRKLLLRD
jgi:hypothetical protein